MRYSTLFLAPLCAFFVSGCASINPFSNPAPQWPWGSDNICKASPCNSNDALESYIKANKFCREVQNYYESGGQRANNTKFGIGVVGTLAGAVVAPIAKGSAASAWAGLSGAANGVQTSLDDAFSTSLAVNRRVAIVAATSAGDLRYQGATTDNARVAASVSMATSCANASALADQNALKSLAQTPQTPQSLAQPGQEKVPAPAKDVPPANVPAASEPTQPK